MLLGGSGERWSGPAAAPHLGLARKSTAPQCAQQTRVPTPPCPCSYTNIVGLQGGVNGYLRVFDARHNPKGAPLLCCSSCCCTLLCGLLGCCRALLPDAARDGFPTSPVPCGNPANLVCSFDARWFSPPPPLVCRRPARGAAGDEEAALSSQAAAFSPQHPTLQRNAGSCSTWLPHAIPPIHPFIAAAAAAAAGSAA